MERRQREAIVAALDGELADHGSWCGETHLQKAMYFLQELLGVPTDFDFILYKYGPFSHELRGELGAMRADGFLELVPQPPYGPSLRVTPTAKRQLLERWPKTLDRYGKRIEFVAGELGPLGVAELERVATALWATRELPGGDETQRAQKINEVKPHVSLEEAREALRRVARMESDVTSRELLAA